MATRFLHLRQKRLLYSNVRRFCSSPHDYDICVIGGGPSGFAAAVRGIDFGKRVCLVEKGELGGSGVDGALSSKVCNCV